MQVNEGDTTDAIEAGYSEGDYTTYEIERKVGQIGFTLKVHFIYWVAG